MLDHLCYCGIMMMETGLDLSNVLIVVAVAAIAIIWYKKTRKG